MVSERCQTLLIPDLEWLASNAVENRQETRLESVPEHDDYERNRTAPPENLHIPRGRNIWNMGMI